MGRAGQKGAAQPLEPDEAGQLFGTALKGASGILLAVSGGPDSMALLGLAAAWPSRPPLAVATVDHGLRAASRDEAELVARQAAAVGLPHRTLRWMDQKPPSGLQEAAREARYALLAKEARGLGFTHIATAHHADDQAETVLMRLAAGSGIAGLAGMRLQSMRDGLVIARPFLGIPKSRLVATCEAHGIPYIQDPSNHEPRYGRTQVRKALETLAGNGLTALRLTRLADRAARADEALARMAKEALEEACFRRTDCVAQADWTALSRQAEEIRLRALALMLGPDLSRQPRLERLETLLSEIDDARTAGRRLRRSIGESIVTLLSNGRLTISPASPRKRGRPRHGS